MRPGRDSAPPSSAAGRGWIGTASWIIVGLGAAARILQFGWCRSLGIDEGSLALNLIGRSFGGLLEPLDSMQAAPVGFLWIERLAVLGFGAGERALRLFPMVCGLAGLVLIRRAALRLLAPGAALVAIAVVALNDDLIWYSNDVKQYSSDGLATIVILLAATSAAGAARSTPRMSRLFLKGAVALFFSHPSCFVLAGVGGAGVLDAALRRDRRDLLRFAAVSAGWLLVFLGAYRISSGATDVAGLRDFWRVAFMPFPPRSADDWNWYWYYPLRFFRDPGNMQPAALVAAIFGAGCVSWWHRSRKLAIAVVAIVVLPLFASAFRLYPFSCRFLLFAVPAVALALGEGASLISTLARRTHSPTARHVVRGAAFAVILFYPAWTSLPELTGPRVQDVDMAGAIADIACEGQPGDILCSEFDTSPVQVYYEQRLDLRRRVDEVRAMPSLDEITASTVAGGALHGRRVWFLFKVSLSIDTFHVRVGNSQDHAADLARVQVVVDRIAARGSIRSRRDRTGIEVCLAEF